MKPSFPPKPAAALADDTACPCGQNLSASKGRLQPVPFGRCCGPLLRGTQTAVHAEALMRSRYTAYVLKDEAYLRASWHSQTCPAELALENDIEWLGLKVHWHKPLDANHAEVAFTARYRQNGKIYRLQEHSRFVCEQGHWLYWDARA